MKNLASLNLNHLYYFWVIASVGSIRKAAQKIHITQPTMSEQLMLLEDRLGQKLFERKNKRLHLTKFGLVVFDYCSAMFRFGNKILKATESENQDLLRIRVGVLPDVSKHLVSDLLLPVLGHKNSFLSVIEGDYRHLLKDLDRGGIDLLFTGEVNSLLPQIFSQKKIKDNEFVAVSTVYPKKVNTFPKALEKLTYIGYTEQSPIHYGIEQFFERSKLHIRKLCEVDDIYLVKLFTLKSRGFSIVPKSSVLDEVASGQLHILGEVPSLNSSLTMIYKDLEENKAILKVLRESILF